MKEYLEKHRDMQNDSELLMNLTDDLVEEVERGEISVFNFALRIIELSLRSADTYPISMSEVRINRELSREERLKLLNEIANYRASDPKLNDVKAYLTSRID